MRCRRGIDEIVAAGDRREVERAARALSESYRAGGSAATRAARTNGDVAAYLATRAPATYAAAAAVFEQIRLARPEWAPTSVVDLGAGPRHRRLGGSRGVARDLDGLTRRGGAGDGARRKGSCRRRAGGAARRALDGGRRRRRRSEGGSRARLLRDRRARAGGARRLRRSRLVARRGHARDRGAGNDGGLRARARRPGSRHGGRRLHARAVPARQPLPAERRRLVPLRDTAPAKPHASAREGRRARLRGREVRLRRPLPWPAPPVSGARIIRRPDLRQGHVVLDLCTTEGLERRTVSRRDGAEYRKARKLGWGDTL